MTPPYPYNSLVCVNEDDRHWWFHCCFHEGDNEASLTVNKTNPFKGFFRCWGCGINGAAKKFIRLKGMKTIVDELQEYHEKYEANAPEYQHPKIDWEKIIEWKLDNNLTECLAGRVGVSSETIKKFDISYNLGYLHPMYNEQGICGVQKRIYVNNGCLKRCLRYSKHGWFMPVISFQGQPIFYKPNLFSSDLFITEGWSDTAVGIELGLWTVGRFNALTVEFPPTIDFDNEVKKTYIISDTDKCGIQGSKKLQRLIPNSKILYPFGYPDIRAKFLKEGAEKVKQWIMMNVKS